MQKKKLYQLAAAIVLVVAVAAALILTGMRKSTPVSEAQASSVPSSALPDGEAEEPSSAVASSESAVSSEVTEESPVSSFLEQLEEELCRQRKQGGQRALRSVRFQCCTLGARDLCGFRQPCGQQSGPRQQPRLQQLRCFGE